MFLEIFPITENTKKTSDGIVVINAIGMNTLKNILREKENELMKSSNIKKRS